MKMNSHNKLQKLCLTTLMWIDWQVRLSLKDKDSKDFGLEVTRQIVALLPLEEMGLYPKEPIHVCSAML